MIQRVLGVAGAALLSLACTVMNYLEPVRPFYETRHGEARDTEPGLRVVTFNVREGQRVAEAVAALARHPDLRDADIADRGRAKDPVATPRPHQAARTHRDQRPCSARFGSGPRVLDPPRLAVGHG